MITQQLRDRISTLATMSPAQLRQEWLALYATAAPALSADLLRLGLAYRIQEKAMGGLSKQARKALEGQAANGSTLRSGMRLVRGWNGRTISVTVNETGFEFDGKQWPSLSAIAKSVTGTQYSGPRFFGIGDHAKR